MWFLLLLRLERNLLLLGLLGEKDGLDVGEDTTLSDGDSGEKFVQLLVITDGELEMSGDDSRLLVVPGGVTGQLEDLSGEVLKDGSQVDGGAGTNSLGVVSLAKESVDTTDGELKPRTAGTALCLSLRLASLSAARHDVCLRSRVSENSKILDLVQKILKISLYMPLSIFRFCFSNLLRSDWFAPSNQRPS